MITSSTKNERYSLLCQYLRDIEKEPSTLNKISLFKDYLLISKLTLSDMQVTGFIFANKEIKNYSSFRSQRIKKTNLSMIPFPLENDLSTEKIVSFIKELPLMEGKNSIKLKEEKIRKLFLELDQNSRYYFLKILSGKLSIGFDSRTFIRSINQFFGTDYTLNYFRQVKEEFALAKKIEKKEIKKEIPFLYEKKYDGIRVKVIKREGQVKIYTRSRQDLSEKFENRNKLFDFCNEICLDGQLVLKDFDDFSKILRSKTRMIEQYSFIFFDLLSIEGEDLSRSPLIRRKERLQVLFSGIGEQKQLRIIDYNIIKKEEQLQSFNKEFRSLPSHYEGFMIKPITSIYQGDKRKWFKYKRDPETLDLIVTKRFLGKGKFINTYSKFQLGILNNNEIIPFVNVGSGLSDHDRKYLNELKWNTEGVPISRIIFEISFQEIMKSRNIIGYSIRFPIVKRIRNDINKVDTLEKLTQLFLSRTQGGSSISANYF